MLLKEEIIKDRLAWFFDENAYNRINIKQEQYIRNHKKNAVIYKIRYRQLCLELDLYLINGFFEKIPPKYQELLKLRYEQGYTFSKISMYLCISKSGIVTMNRKIINYLTSLFFYDVKKLFADNIIYEIFSLTINILPLLHYRIKEEISFLLRNNLYIDISFDYLKNLYQKEKLLSTIEKLFFQELQTVNQPIKQIILYKKENPFVDLTTVSKKYNFGIRKTKKEIYNFRNKIVFKIINLES